MAMEQLIVTETEGKPAEAIVLWERFRVIREEMELPDDGFWEPKGDADGGEESRSTMTGL